MVAHIKDVVYNGSGSVSGSGSDSDEDAVPCETKAMDVLINLNEINDKLGGAGTGTSWHVLGQVELPEELTKEYITVSYSMKETILQNGKLKRMKISVKSQVSLSQMRFITAQSDKAHLQKKCESVAYVCDVKSRSNDSIVYRELDRINGTTVSALLDSC